MDRPALAQASQTAACISFAGGPGGETLLGRDNPRVVAPVHAIGPVAELWVNTQLAAGKDQFFAAAVAANASVVCAW